MNETEKRRSADGRYIREQHSHAEESRCCIGGNLTGHWRLLGERTGGRAVGRSKGDCTDPRFGNGGSTGLNSRGDLGLLMGMLAGALMEPAPGVRCRLRESGENGIDGESPNGDGPTKGRDGGGLNTAGVGNSSYIAWLTNTLPSGVGLMGLLYPTGGAKDTAAEGVTLLPPAALYLMTIMAIKMTKAARIIAMMPPIKEPLRLDPLEELEELEERRRSKGSEKKDRSSRHHVFAPPTGLGALVPVEGSDAAGAILATLMRSRA